VAATLGDIPVVAPANIAQSNAAIVSRYR